MLRAAGVFRKYILSVLRVLYTKMSTTASKIIVNTGNVLNLIEIKQKAGQNVTEELMESLQITVAEWEKNAKNADHAASHKGTGENEKNSTVVISRLHDDVHAKMAEEDRKNLKIGIKIFVQDDSIASLTDCLENVYKTLNIEAIDNLVLAYYPPSVKSVEVNGDVVVNGEGEAIVTQEISDLSEDSSKCDRILPGLKVLWGTLEKYVLNGRITQLGVSDLGESCFKRLHFWSTVKPTIVQINLSSCCVVPPGLQAFCKDNDVQLLTHSDPQEIISAKAMGSILKGRVTSVDWCIRHQVHIRCRGVLALKGYVICATLEKQ